MPYAVLAAALVALDQLVKYLVSHNIPLGGHVPLLPHLVELTYFQNTGAAFSMLEEHTWLLTLISALVAVVIVAVMAKKVVRHRFGLVCLSVVLAGAVGNLIDRLFLGFVTDMFQTTFISFAVFNVADICVVLGGIAFCVYFLFFYDKLEKGETPHGDSASDA